MVACAIDSPTDNEATPVEVSGQQVFTSYCGLCHGANGEGYVNALDAAPINADGDAYLLSNAEIREIILNGTLEAGGLMPGITNQLSVAQVSAVIDYLPSLWTAEQQAAHAAAESP